MLRPILVGLILGSLACAGCSRSFATPTVLREETVHVSTEDPSVTIDGETIGVDGLPPGETLPLKISHYRTTGGVIGVDIDMSAKE